MAGYGIKIDFKALYLSDVNCEFKSEFKSVGINQTLHSIYVVVVSRVNVEIPLSKKTVVCKTEVLIAESVLIGKVPEFYFNNESESQ